MLSIKKPLAMALLGALAIATGGFLLLTRASTGMPADTDIAGHIQSLDGAYKAVVFYSDGGGAGSSYCFDTVSVVPTQVTDKDAWDERDVFSAGCAGDLLSNIVWISPRHLQITFNPTLAVQGIDSVTLRGNAGKDGEVEISYVMR